VGNRQPAEAASPRRVSPGGKRAPPPDYPAFDARPGPAGEGPADGLR